MDADIPSLLSSDYVHTPLRTISASVAARFVFVLCLYNLIVSRHQTCLSVSSGNSCLRGDMCDGWQDHTLSWGTCGLVKSWTTLFLSLISYCKLGGFYLVFFFNFLENFASLLPTSVCLLLSVQEDMHSRFIGPCLLDMGTADNRLCRSAKSMR